MAFVIREHEPLAPHTVFKIGGPADVYVEAATTDELIRALQEAKSRDIPWCILGAGSNVLVSDAGYRGVVIHPTGGSIRFDGDGVTADAGVTMARVVAESLRHSLRGFEWAIGVPGTIGGSVRGNAGCFGSEMKDVVRAVHVYDADRGVREVWPADRASFGYRESAFKHRPEIVVLSCELALVPGDRREGEGLVREYTAHRAKTQDIGSQSAGCIFKNIPWGRPDIVDASVRRRFPNPPPSGTVDGISAGFLVDQAGLKGYRIGGASISQRHGNFFLNSGGATAEDVRSLIRIAKDAVREKFGLTLEEEIQYVGF